MPRPKAVLALGGRGAPRGDPPQARRRRGPQQPRLRPERQGKLDEAIAAYREAIRLKPDDAEAHYNLGIALSGQGKLDEAIAEYREAIRLKPDYAEAHYNLGIALDGQGKLDEAIAEYREAIRLKPDYAEAHYNLGIALTSQGKPTRRSPNTARRSGSSPTTPRPTPTSASPWRLRAKLHEAIAAVPRGDPPQARHAAAHNNLGDALRESGRSSTRRSPRTARRSGSSPTTPRPTTTSASPWRLGRRYARRSPTTARRSGSSPTTPRPTTTSARPGGSGRSRRGDRRIPRGDPAQARLRRGPLQPRHRPGDSGEAATRRSPRSARRSGSSPTTPRPTPTSASPWAPRATCDEAIAAYREAIRLKPDTPGPLQPRQRPVRARAT